MESELVLPLNDVCLLVALSLYSWMPTHMDSTYFRSTNTEAEECVSRQKRRVWRWEIERPGLASRRPNGHRMCHIQKNGQSLTAFPLRIVARLDMDMDKLIPISEKDQQFVSTASHFLA